MSQSKYLIRKFLQSALMADSNRAVVMH